MDKKSCLTSCSTSSVCRREAMETQASTARSLTESCRITFQDFDPKKARGLTFTAPNLQNGYKYQKGKCFAGIQMKYTKTLAALEKKLCGFKLTNTIYKFNRLKINTVFLRVFQYSNHSLNIGRQNQKNPG